MLKLICIVIGSFIHGLSYAGTPTWTITQTPSSETFNGISAANNYFAIGVGKNGSIVHFKNGDAGTIVPSGTTNELFDVYAVSENLAIASGKDIVLLWNGTAWSKIVDINDDRFFTGTWITPEKDVAFYQSLGIFNFIFPHLPGVPLNQQPFGRGFSYPMLTACGNSSDIKLFTSDGDIHHIDKFLSEISGTADIPLHNEVVPLEFTALYVPKTSCLPLGIAPINAYAIRLTNQFWKFNGETWTNMNVTVPAGQTLSWLGGTSASQIFAVGFKSDGNGGNTGVIWKYDGITWIEETNLPSGLLGLTDVSASIGRVDDIFSSGFESNSNRADNVNRRVDILAAAEAGKKIDLGDVLPPSYIDLSVRKTLLTPEPIKVNDIITFQLEVKNVGNTAATDFLFFDGYINTIQHQSNDCGMTFHANNAEENSTFRKEEVPLLGIGDSIVCTMTFKVIGSAGEVIKNMAAIKEEEYQFDVEFANNSTVLTNIVIQPE